MRRIIGLPANNPPTVQSVWAKAIENDLRQQGRNVERILAEAGLAQRTINREGGRIPWLAQSRLMEIAAGSLPTTATAFISRKGPMSALQGQLPSASGAQRDACQIAPFNWR